MEKTLHCLKKDHPILVVDDEPMVLEVIAKMLAILGYPVETARGSEEAIARLTESKFRLVITDFNMPTLNGLQLAAWIKQYRPRTKVVIMTGWSNTDATEIKTGGDVDALMLKPIRLRELRNCISEWDDSVRVTLKGEWGCPPLPSA